MAGGMDGAEADLSQGSYSREFVVCRGYGTAGARLPEGTVLNRSDGYQYVTDSELIINAGEGTTSITAVLPDLADDSTGGGSDGNADAGNNSHA